MQIKEKILLKRYRGITDSASVISEKLLSSHKAKTGTATGLSLVEDLSSRVAPNGSRAKYTMLNRRCHNHWDGLKEFGVSEAYIHDIKRDVQEMESRIKGAMEVLQTKGKENSRLAALPPQRVVFLVCFSQTRHNRGVGQVFLSIVQQCRRLLETEPLFASCQVLRVIPVFVGLQYEEEYLQSFLDLKRGDYFFYADAGLYSLNILLQYISAAQAETRKRAAANREKPPIFYEMMLFSESFLHPRTVVSLNTNSMCKMNVFPGLVMESMSTAEVSAYAQYTACLLKKSAMPS
ncbi:hypothetical protein, conserved [Angomonas deanei]|uniref:Uncharacterized protein n=1 Tax=Angomonas deanei TaxID=59799 RepID=A0A7G2CAM8_9TRYP|nr:hypothetical protein, conserved [Angomonas deanei]